jgi:methanogenic corrinoid protein MtbC1
VFAEYWAALAAGDAGAAAAVALRELEDGIPLLDLLDQLVSAGQAEVGRRWAANEWNVDAEASGRTVLITCADGEWHSLPARVLSAALREAGWRVTFLGASVPARHLGQMLHDLGPDLTAVSCALPTRLFEARQMIEISRGAGIPVLVGGRGFGPDGRWATVLGADAWAPDARAAVDVAAGQRYGPFTSPVPELVQPDDAVPRLRSRSRGIVRFLQAGIAAVPQ